MAVLSYTSEGIGPVTVNSYGILESGFALREIIRYGIRKTAIWIYQENEQKNPKPPARSFIFPFFVLTKLTRELATLFI